MNISDYFSDLVRTEGCTTWLYCDSRGFVTVGIGNLVATADAAAALPWAVGKDDPRSAWCRVHNAFGPAKPSAQYYQLFSDLRITVEYASELLAARLQDDFLPGIAKLCPGFDSFPLPARRALVDMAYNLGVGGLSGFPHMLAACNAGDWERAAARCHRSTCRDSTNAWTAQMFLDAAASGPTSPVQLRVPQP